MDIYAIALAAGEGKRMKSALPKPLHRVCGKPLIDCVIDALSGAGAPRITVVVDPGAHALKAHIGARAACAEQDFTLGRGTGRAVQAALTGDMDGAVYVLCGDMPLVRPETFMRLYDSVARGAACALCYVTLDEPRDGRVELNAAGRPMRIIEHKDTTPETARIRTINASIYCFDAKKLRGALEAVRPSPATGEYYLTDAIGILGARGEPMEAFEVDGDEGIGVNDRAQLAQAEAAMRRRINEHLMRGGVTMIDPERTYIDASVTLGEDTIVYPGCTLAGATHVGARCTLLPNCRIEDSVIGDDVTIEASVLTGAAVGDGTRVGPFAYLRPGARVGKRVRVGDFVEVKNSAIGDGTSVAHLAYVGDADVGADVNISCGVVFSNYDGKYKHRSTVGEGAFVGCNVNLVSPVEVGAGAYIAAGSTVTVDVPAGALLIARERETIKEGWVHKRKQEGKL